jgi:hypothetical protein
MADQLYLNLWFPSFPEQQMMPRLLSVLRQFPFAKEKSGVGFVAVHPVDWAEPLVFQQTFDYRAEPEHAVHLMGEYPHADYAYEVEAAWDLWTPQQEGELDVMWRQSPQPVRFFALGTEFDEGAYQEDGHIQIDLGLDTPFLLEEETFAPDVLVRVKQNIQKLVAFTHAIEKNCGITGRVLWSESEENLAQKLIESLQRVQ